MEYFTVGAASALIAAIVVIFQLFYANALALVLTSGLEDSHSAVTWSVVSRFLLSSHWPILLNSESTTSRKVDKRVSAIVWMRPIGLSLIALAAIITPLGLYEEIAASAGTKAVSFVYAPDQSRIGQSSPSRENVTFGRACTWAACSGWTSDIPERNGSDTQPTVQVPSSIAQIFQSGLKYQLPSVSSFFDIQFRQFLQRKAADVRFTISTYQVLTSVALSDNYELIEGLIIDAKTNSIGFRNHTVPDKLQYGAEWEEDILFLEPDAVCVDTNVSARYTTHPKDYIQFGAGRFVDKGGFSGMNMTKPYPLSDKDIYPDGQYDPSLYGRAYYTAYLVNKLNMLYLGIAKPNFTSEILSHEGLEFPSNSSVVDWDYGSFRNIYITDYLHEILSVPFLSNTSNQSDYVSQSRYANPWKISESDYSTVGHLCSGTWSDTLLSISRIGVTCGVFAGSADRIDGGSVDSANIEDTVWEKPVYICAGATKASIKTVNFRYDTAGAPNLARLTVLAISDKMYDTKEKEPIWGVENHKNTTLAQIDPIWGLVSPEFVNSPNVSTIQSPQLYLPASSVSTFHSPGGFFTLDGTPGSGSDFMPAATGPFEIWNALFKSPSRLRGPSATYDGNRDFKMSMVWRELSKTPEGAAKIIKSIWMDIATNALVGTRSWTDPQDSIAPNLQKRQNQQTYDSAAQLIRVHVLERKVRYKWAYGIPAFISLALMAATLIVTTYATILGGSSITQLRFYLNKLTAGRIFTAFLYPAPVPLQSMPPQPQPQPVDPQDLDAKQWVDMVGFNPVYVGKEKRAFASFNVDGSSQKYMQLSRGPSETTLQRPFGKSMAVTGSYRH